MEDRQWGSILGALTGGAGGAALGNALGSAAGITLKDMPNFVSTEFHFFSQVLLLEVTETSEELEEL